MILCVECGNTSIKLGLFEHSSPSLVNMFKIRTNTNQSNDEYAIIIDSLVKDVEIEGVILSSVVPNLTNILKDCLERLYKVDVKVLNSKLKTKTPIKIDNPKELGADFLTTAVAAKKKYNYPLIVADLGTATKISVIDKTGALIGGIITSGMKISLDSLTNNAAQLYEVNLTLPKHIIGKNSIECIQSGIIYGQAYMIDEFSRQIENELGYKVERVLTGGYSNLIKNEISSFHYDENLSLEGLYYIYLMNEEVKSDEK